MAQETGLFDARIADRLYRSCEEGDVEQLRRLLETKSPNTLQIFRDTIREYSALQPSPLVAAASSGHYRVVQMLMESDLVTGLPRELDFSALPPISAALLLGESVVPPAPTYKAGDRLQLRYMEPIVANDDALPYFAAEANLSFVERYELEGVLPAGVKLDAHTGALTGTPATIPFDRTVKVRAVNSLGRSQPCSLRVVVTSDISELLGDRYQEYAASLSRLFPTVLHMKGWYEELDASDQAAALDAVLENEIGVESITHRFALKGLFKRTLESNDHSVASPSPAPSTTTTTTTTAATTASRSGTTAASLSSSSSDGYRIDPGRVVVGAHIADGGQAAVHQGDWLGVAVAIKVFRFGSENKLPAKIRSAIDREIGVLSALRHPHIVQLYGYFQDERRTGVVMEYCGDGDLSEFSVDKPLFEKLSLAKQVLVALNFLHTQEPPVIHGDVKPQNVLIQHGKAKLADFGMSAGSAVVGASAAVSVQSKAGATGTNAYAAPEVLSGGRRALTPASDVHSFGMLLFHLVEESVPWFGEADDFIVRQVVAGMLPPFESEAWTPELQQLVRGCCALDAADRYSAEEALQRLAGILQRMAGTGESQLDRIERRIAAIEIASL